MEIMAVIDIFILGYGLYCFISSFKMRKDGKPAQWLVNADESMRMRHPKEFAAHMFPRTLIFSIFCVVYGVLALLNDVYFANMMAEMIGLAVFFVALIWYIVILRRAKSKYT